VSGESENRHEILSASGPGILHATTGVIARHNGNITSVEIIEDGESGTDNVYFEIERRAIRAYDRGPAALPIVRHADKWRPWRRSMGNESSS